MTGDFKRIVRVKGCFGEVEIICHDTKEDRHSVSGEPIDKMIDHAIRAYRAIEETGKEYTK